MIQTRLILSLVLALGAYTRVTEGKPVTSAAEEGDTVSLEDLGKLALDQDGLGRAAAETREGKVRIERFKSLMKDVAKKWRGTGIYLDEKHKSHECFVLHHPQRQVDLDKVDVKIRATTIKPLSGGDTYILDGKTIGLIGSFRATASDNTNSNTQVSSWEGNGEIGIGPIAKAFGLGLGLSAKGGGETTTKSGTTQYRSKESGTEYSVTLTKGRKSVCPANHECNLQAWTYQAEFQATAPAIPTFDLECLSNKKENIGDQPWQVPQSVLDFVKNANPGKIYTSYGHDQEEVCHLRPVRGTCEKFTFPNKKKVDLCSLQQTGCVGPWYGKVSWDLVDSKLGPWAETEEGPKYYKKRAQDVDVGSWRYDYPGIYQYRRDDDQLQSEYLQHRQLTFDFPIRKPKSASLQTAIVLVKTPHATDRKRGADDAATVEIIAEDADLDAGGFDFLESLA